ncbi:MAG: hypothetical protein COT91_01345 [Candidatus Doudnabacteria bacterium CG10_big_fil_rev_8_21_14_0_10_41_10]|uniref:DUF948 domain-containing protein n=1 Tax=Candidatus Doudnabacteria bacterium CG10_big_fil_rev_8_21_14_0_10_41_10 TaxID=1974551 RepID=A0A2H0VEA1_9BACT|nr:MAG: hypothetical protein COT91_01345 [Candidatus Doudnabacteria bacterium CG10_big_fil_rev_8_21_14_0_10_41_10]
MESIIKSDIFFFVTTVITILLAILVAVVLVYLIKILRDAKKIIGHIKQEAEAIAKDITGLRETVRQEGEKIRKFVDFLGTLSLGKYFVSDKKTKKRLKKA